MLIHCYPFFLLLYFFILSKQLCPQGNHMTVLTHVEPATSDLSCLKILQNKSHVNSGNCKFCSVAPSIQNHCISATGLICVRHITKPRKRSENREQEIKKQIRQKVGYLVYFSGVIMPPAQIEETIYTFVHPPHSLQMFFQNSPLTT